MWPSPASGAAESVDHVPGVGAAPCGTVLLLQCIDVVPGISAGLCVWRYINDFLPMNGYMLGELIGLRNSRSYIINRMDSICARVRFRIPVPIRRSRVLFE